jgi:hypothetical protein
VSAREDTPARRDAPGAAVGGCGTRARSHEPGSTGSLAKSESPRRIYVADDGSRWMVRACSSSGTRKSVTCVGAPQPNFSHARSDTSATSVQPASETFPKT